MIKYKIVEVHDESHSIVVRYYTDKITEQSLAIDTLDGVIRRCRTDYSIDLPVPAPTGDDLHKFIIRYAPTQWFEIQEAVLDPAIDTSLTAIKQELNKEVVATPSTADQNVTPPEAVPYDPALVAAVQKILVDFNVITPPPTT